MVGLGLQEILVIVLGLGCCVAVLGGIGAAIYLLTRDRRQRPPDA